MNVAELKDFRVAAKLSQTDLAELMGMKLRSYQDVESGVTPLNARHAAAAERASLRLAVERRDLALALPAIRRDAIDYVAMLRGEGQAAGEAPNP